MKKISSLLTAIAAVAVISAPAVAADMRMPMKAAPAPVMAVFNWTGFYIGGFAGGAVADRDAASTEPASAAGIFYNGTGANNTYPLGSSFIGGGTIGYNWQPVGSAWVFGLEGEAGYIRLQKSRVDINPLPAGAPGADTVDATRLGDWYGVIAGRLGYAFDRVLVYAKGGVAFVDKEYTFTDGCTAAPCGPGRVALGRSDTDVTWAAGGGIEWAFAPNWSVKGEYLYLATRETVGSSGVITAGVAAGTTVANSHQDPGIHTGKLGVNFRF